MNNIHIASIGILIALCFVHLVISDVSHLVPPPVQQQQPFQQQSFQQQTFPQQQRQQQAPGAGAGNDNKIRILFALFIHLVLSN